MEKRKQNNIIFMKNMKIKIFTNDINSIISSAKVNCIKDFFKFKNDFCYKKNKYRAVYKISSKEGKEYFLKRFYRLSISDFFYAVFKKLSPAMREYRNVKLFESLGIKTMLALCVGEKSKCGIPVESFIITESLERFPRLEDVIEKKWSKYNYEKRKQIVKKLAQIVARLHKNNYFHKDLYLGHILFDEENLEFYVIDLQRVEKHNIGKKRWIVKDLASLNYSADLCDLSNKVRILFFREYSSIVGINYRNFIKSIKKKTEKIKRHTFKLLMRKAEEDGKQK